MPANKAGSPKSKATLSDPHNNGRSVRIVRFEDGARVVYKPKDLQADIAWRGLIERLNGAGAPIDLKAVGALARDGYGWTEFIDHAGTDQAGCERFFRRAGAWLALFHCFAASDMHQENMIAAGDHPLPIDLETLLQAPAVDHDVRRAGGPGVRRRRRHPGQFGDDGRPAAGLWTRPDNKVFAIGGMTATGIQIKSLGQHQFRCNAAGENDGDGRHQSELAACRRPLRQVHRPHRQLHCRLRGTTQNSCCARRARCSDGFAGAAVRRVIRPTRFYSMLLMRLRNYRSMDDGVTWSAQADFIARLADWDNTGDPLWRRSAPNGRRCSRSTCRTSCRRATAT